MINIAICDDDTEELEIIVSLASKSIGAYNIPFKITSFNEGQYLIEHMNSNNEKFDIIFLDIYMKTSNGIDVARKIRGFNNECKIIFITSSKEHAIDSYEVKATYYILKPIDEKKFSIAIKLAIDELVEENKSIVITNKDGVHRILYEDIVYLESVARTINIHLKSSEIITFYSKLEGLLQGFQDGRFIKCHKSFIVNMDYVTKVGKKCVFIDDSISIPISNTNITGIKEIYFKYLLK